jgi:hypothetical protein
MENAEVLDFSNFQEMSLLEKDFNLPFPMGVFGTLRENCGNHYLMKQVPYSAKKKAFMPNWYAQGLSIGFSKECCAPFEIYFYTPENWKKMIGRVDTLESFSPQRADSKTHGYFRTLANLHVLPDDFEHPLFNNFNTNESTQLYGVRDLKIPKETWNDFEKVPCWVYASQSQNKACNGYPIIWG